MGTWTESKADGYVKWLRQRVGPQLIFLVYTTSLVFDDRDRLLVQRRYDFDWLSLPGGALELGEGLSACALRETREETGIEIAIDRVIGVFSHPDYTLHYPNGDVVQPWSVAVVARPVGGSLRADANETLSAQWMDLAEALPQFPRAYQDMVRAAQRARAAAPGSPECAHLEPVFVNSHLHEYYPVLRRHLGHEPIILPGVMAVIRDEAGRVLVARRIEGQLLDVPGGFCDLGETTTHAVIREVREETGLEVEPVRVIGLYSEDMQFVYANGDEVHGVGIAFECRVTGGMLRADQEEIAEVSFVPVAELLAQPAPPGMLGMGALWTDLVQPERWPVLR